MRRQTKTISFRLELETYEKVEEQRKAFGNSRGDWCRGIIITWLNLIQQKQSIEPIQVQMLEELRNQVENMKRAQAKATCLLLTACGNLSTEDATDLVRRKIVAEEADE